MHGPALGGRAALATGRGGHRRGNRGDYNFSPHAILSQPLPPGEAINEDEFEYMVGVYTSAKTSCFL